jgi:glycosyltransferase involved in cell wall biosynthesis
MISVIIPTLWIGQRYKEMLPEFQANPLVGEIIIIDNDVSKTDQTIFNFSKVVHLPQKENIYVNPAWNLGARVAKHDILCFANDDIAIDLRFLEFATRYTTNMFGMLGVGKGTIANLDELCGLGGDATLSYIEHPGSYFATFFLIHKESYRNIPEQMKIYYGDTYLFKKNVKEGRKNLQLVDGHAVTTLGTSSRMFGDILEKDYSEYQKLLGIEI